MNERRSLAAREFHDLVDLAATASVSLGFMNEAYQDAIRDHLNFSQTLMGIIITGSSGEYTFERYGGNTIVWSGTLPRFRTGTGYPSEPFHRAIRVEGQRNVTVQATYSYFDNAFFLSVLRNTLLAVLVALTVAFITLLIEMSLRNRSYYAYEDQRDIINDKEDERSGLGSEDNSFDTSFADIDFSLGIENTGDDDFASSFKEEPDDLILPFEDLEFFTKAGSDDPLIDLPLEDEPLGLFSPKSNLGWESYAAQRLESELHRCASFEQDLVFLAMEFKDDNINDPVLYRQFADEAVNFFTLKDLIFERGEMGISVILPNTDLEQGMNICEEFRSMVIDKLPESFYGRIGLCIGLSSRSGRLIGSDRLMLEAFTALEKALEDPDPSIIGFKSDLDRYREFIKRSSFAREV
ncbi:MAG: hypothetical protein FWH12_09035 [Treponema sp.]|nr:hypothetical protein [Treponema sp.]